MGTPKVYTSADGVARVTPVVLLFALWITVPFGFGLRASSAEDEPRSEEVARALIESARTHAAEGRLEDAQRTALEAVIAFQTLRRHDAPSPAARLPEALSEACQIGIGVSRELEDTGSVFSFLEWGLAGDVLFAMDVRRASRPDPDPVVDEERVAAQAELANARAGMHAALHSGSLLEARKTRAAYRAAEARYQRALVAVWAARGRVAELPAPAIASLADVQAVLRDDEALVVYGLRGNAAFALVLGKRDLRLVELGASADLCAAILDFAPLRRREDPLPSLGRLRDRLVTPLALAESIQRVVVVPSGSIHLLPSGLLFEGRTVSWTPSGTVLAALRSARPERGRQVLAIGDPAYGAEPLVPLPGTRKEAKAIGDVHLLGEEATESGLLAALATASRWRAIHFATHGVADPKRPLWSAVVLAADAIHDGRLTALEVRERDIPADLVVLGSSDSARVGVVPGDGVVGLVPAFLAAGVQGVIGTIAPIDDSASTALMLRFHELWNPDEGEGLDAADALRRAQAYVAAQEQWAHPFFWAGWQFWGASR